MSRRPIATIIVLVGLVAVTLANSSDSSPATDLVHWGPWNFGSAPSTGGSSAGGPVPSGPPYNLISSGTDDNWFLLNPKWLSQISHGELPYPDLCGGSPWQAPCTSQNPKIDGSRFYCPSRPPIYGHANWPWAVTFEGIVFWDPTYGHSAESQDDDFNIELVREDMAGLTRGHTSLHMEFDSRETVRHFRSPWWSSLWAAVHEDDLHSDYVVSDEGYFIRRLRSGQTSKAAPFINGKEAIASGLFGLDCAHECKSELHPVWALAIHVQHSPDDDIWAIFVRNWGNEGYCSDQQHYVDVRQVRFLIPMSNATSGGALESTIFLTRNLIPGHPSIYSVKRGYSVEFVPGEGVLVSFDLLEPEARELIDGELHLQWTVPSGYVVPPPTGTRAVPPQRVKEDYLEPEQRIAALVARMTPAQRKTYEALRLKEPISHDEARLPLKSPARAPRLRGKITSASPSRLSKVPQVRSVYDPQKAENDRLNLEALRAVLGENYPELPPKPPSSVLPGTVPPLLPKPLPPSGPH